MAKKMVEVVSDKFVEDLAKAGLGGFVKDVVDRDDMDVDVLPTGLPRLDNILHPGKKGLPLGRMIEVFSRDPEVGKTSIALQIGAHWQKLGKIVVIVDVEDTVTKDFLEELGYILTPEKDSGIHPPYIAKGYDEDTDEVLSAEEITDKVSKISKIADLVIIDSLGALAKRADLEKEPGDATMGGIGKIMWEYVRKNRGARATEIWINQALPQIGVFSPAGIKYKTGGGMAIPFKSTIRLELRLVEKLRKNKDEDPYGVVIDICSTKNKVSPQDRHVKLTYIHGEGFSPTWDLFAAALAAKVLEKKGSWINFGESKWQGELNVYAALKADPLFQDELRKALADATKTEDEECLLPAEKN